MVANLHRLLIISCVAMSCQGIQAQSLASLLFAEGDSRHAQSDFAGALQKFDSSRTQALRNEEYLVYFDAFGMLLDCLHKNSEFRMLEAEIDSFNINLRRYQDNIGSSFYHRYLDVARIFSILVYKAFGDSEGALNILEPLLDSLNALLPSPDSMAIFIKRFKIQLYISEVYLAQGNYEQTLYYANEAIIQSKPFRDQITQDGMILKPHNTLVTNYLITGRTEEAIGELNLILELLPGLEERRTERTVEAYLRVSNLYLRNGNLDSALYYIQLLKRIDKTGSHRLDASMLEGEIYQADGDYEHSQQIYLAVSKVLVDIGAGQSELSAQCHLQLGKIAMKQGQLQEALKLLHLTLLNFSDDFENPDPLSTPISAQLYNGLTPVEIIYYKSKALYELYHYSGDTNYLSSAWKTVNLGVDIVDKLRKSYYDPEDKAFLIEQSYRIFEHALKICHYRLSFPDHESWVDSAFVLMERSKALNLLDAVMHENARKFAGIPESLLKTEAALRLEIAGQEESIRQLKESQGYSESSLRKKISELSEKERLYRELLETVETEHPGYFHLRYGSSAFLLSDVQKLLGNSQTVIEYFMGESEIYMLVVEKHRKQLHVNRHANDIEKHIVNYRSTIQACVDGRASRVNDSLYLNAAIALYDSLVRPAMPLRESIIIVQDGPLNYLSFAGLLADNPEQYYDMRNQPYMVWDHEILYCYSMGLYHELQLKQRTDEEKSIVFAPEFDASVSRGQLMFNEAEARRVADQTNGQAYIGIACTASTVREKLQGFSEYRVVHFATHGVADVANGTDSYLQFAGPPDSNRLYARELYNYSLHADLVYLSACETGSGQLRRGEGIISIARAFFYAGTRSMVTALWSISDERAKDLTVRFYDELMQGQSIDRSVARAQRGYIKSISPQERYLAHPAFWSALVPIGSSAAITPGGDLLWIGLVAGLLGIFFLLRKKFHRRTS